MEIEGLIQREFLIDDDDDVVMFAVLQALEDAEDREDVEVVAVDINGWRKLSNGSFKENFRMDRTTFQRLIVVVGRHMQATNRLQRHRTPLDLCLLMALWPIFNPDTYRSSSKHFGKDKSVIHFHYRYVIEVLRELSSRYIKWPTPIERDRISTSFETRYGYPGVVGCIDGVHIRITAPLEQPQRYVDRHHQYSILVQAVCDHRLLYRDIFVGGPGCVGDARNFKRSPLSTNLLTRPEMMSDGEHLLGDGAYTLTSKVMIPFLDDGHLTPRQRTHNFILSKVRSSVERSFALMRAKHRRMKYLPMRNMEYLVDHIVASFVLHNFIILEGEDIVGLDPIEEVLDDNGEEQNYEQLLEPERHAGTLKREYIAHLLHGYDED